MKYSDFSQIFTIKSTPTSHKDTLLDQILQFITPIIIDGFESNSKVINFGNICLLSKLLRTILSLSNLLSKQLILRIFSINLNLSLIIPCHYA